MQYVDLDERNIMPSRGDMGTHILLHLTGSFCYLGSTWLKIIFGVLLRLTDLNKSEMLSNTDGEGKKKETR